jgi:hypothetical protein
MEYKSYLPEFGYNKHTNLYTTFDDDTAYAREAYAKRTQGKV